MFQSSAAFWQMRIMLFVIVRHVVFDSVRILRFKHVAIKTEHDLLVPVGCG